MNFISFSFTRSHRDMTTDLGSHGEMQGDAPQLHGDNVIAVTAAAAAPVDADIEEGTENGDHQPTQIPQSSGRTGENSYSSSSSASSTSLSSTSFWKPLMVVCAATLSLTLL